MIEPAARFSGSVIVDNTDYIEMLHCLRAQYFGNATEQYTDAQITRGAALYTQGWKLKRCRDVQKTIEELTPGSLAHFSDQLEEGYPVVVSTFHYFLYPPKKA